SAAGARGDMGGVTRGGGGGHAHRRHRRAFVARGAAGVRGRARAPLPSRPSYPLPRDDHRRSLGDPRARSQGGGTRRATRGCASLGRREGATEGTLAIVVGGPVALVERARPILERMGKNVFHAGPLGSGHAIKLVNNMCSAGILALTIEAVAVAGQAGGGPTRAGGIIHASSARSQRPAPKVP